MFSGLTYFNFALVGLAVVLLRTYISRSRQRARYPPGPKGLPVIGNVLDMPKEHEWLTFASWGEKYGDIVYLSLLGQPMVILNSAKHAVALLDKRSNIYSDRPVLAMAGELVGWSQLLALLPYGERFREYRRFMAKLIGSKTHMVRHLPLVEHETRSFLRRLLRHPDAVTADIRKTAGAIILTLSYGYEIQEECDPYVALVNAAMEQFATAMTPGAFLVDVFPLLRYVPAWFPGASFKAKARVWKDTLHTMADVPHKFVKEQMANNAEIPNFTSELLRDEKMDDEKEFNIKWSAASLYSGGADTTVSAIHTFILTMALFPHAQKRAQAEIDAVIGGDRLPTFADRSSLPYVEGLYKEVLRWHPVGPLGLTHRLTQDDEYEGYLLPKGTLVIANIWKFMHDPEVYPNPSEFDPMRHCPDDGKAAAPDPRNYCFGFGRRICPGLHLADASVWLACAMVLATFDIEKPVVDGKVVEIHPEFTSGTVSHPKPFKCTIEPRSSRARALIVADEEHA
ncbi:cytochrome P450 [Phanerochaete sordida]|uniref:Cytochrome P450 n=1 Tax=Phanerochaete sordida TaxID=48140 RepID=A0A9P3G1I7_9APHY|nr:cytochrome P450 [Phanerochaete sordida]